ncbi:MAG: helix-turn-helix transcriptional regulator [Paludibacteraceae bacterium]|nr:helix-turn-helix transcriptional regulator [Paludibacteraceae bacterium]
MIDYSPFWETLKKSDLNWYKLVNKHNFSRSVLTRMKKGQPISLRLVDDLCNILDCDITDICIQIRDKKDNKENK